MIYKTPPISTNKLLSLDTHTFLRKKWGGGGFAAITHSLKKRISGGVGTGILSMLVKVVLPTIFSKNPYLQQNIFKYLTGFSRKFPYLIWWRGENFKYVKVGRWWWGVSRVAMRVKLAPQTPPPCYSITPLSLLQDIGKSGAITN